MLAFRPFSRGAAAAHKCVLVPTPPRECMAWPLPTEECHRKNEFFIMMKTYLFMAKKAMTFRLASCYGKKGTDTKSWLRKIEGCCYSRRHVPVCRPLHGLSLSRQLNPIPESSASLLRSVSAGLSSIYMKSSK